MQNIIIIIRMGSNGTGKITQPNCQRTENNEKQRLNSSSFSLLQIHPFKSDLLHVADGQTAKFLTASPPGLVPVLFLAQRTASPSSKAMLRNSDFPFLTDPRHATFLLSKLKSRLSFPSAMYTAPRQIDFCERANRNA